MDAQGLVKAITYWPGCFGKRMPMLLRGMQRRTTCTDTTVSIQRSSPSTSIYIRTQPRLSLRSTPPTCPEDLPSLGLATRATWQTIIFLDFAHGAPPPSSHILDCPLQGRCVCDDPLPFTHHGHVTGKRRRCCCSSGSSQPAVFFSSSTATGTHHLRCPSSMY
jgi:hypothetical protein